MPETIVIGGDLRVNRLGYGAMRLAGPGIWGDPADRDAARRVLRRAVELGVNFIDTADAYGPATNELLIADALHPYPPGLVIATKGGIVRPSRDRWDGDGRPDHLRAACAASLRRLRVERIDLYQLHTIDPEVPLEDSLGEIARLQQEGKIRHVGVSNVDADELARAAARRGDRFRAEPLQRVGPLVRPGARGLRARRSRVHPVVAAHAEPDATPTRSVRAGSSRPGRRVAASRSRRRRSPGCWRARRRCCRSPVRPR